MKDMNDNDKKLLLGDSMRSSSPIIINDSLNISLIEEEQSFCTKFMNKLKAIPLLFYFLMIIIILGLSIMIYFICFYNGEIPNFQVSDGWVSPAIDPRFYQIHTFDNGLEVMLIRDPIFDRDGGAIVIEKGYLDNPFEEGLSNFITHFLSYLNFNNTPYDIDTLKNYYGSFEFGDEGHFINFRFDILNNGFKKFLAFFSPILDLENIENFEKIKENVINDIIEDYEENKKYISEKENHLIEYLVFGFKNSTDEDILPEGNPSILNQINLSQVKDYLEKLINPSKIKIVIFSKYKFSLSSKYMKHNFKYLIDKKNITEKTDSLKEQLKNKEFNKSQIFYIKSGEHDTSYVKIIYYIDKVNNEDFSELTYKKSYFYYISDFLEKNKNGSLYYSIRNRIKSIETSVNVILKSKIEFSIQIELTNLTNINDIIYLTYQYIHKIINETDEKNIQMDRYEELKDICRNNQNLTENSYNTIELAKANAEHLFESKYAQNYYYYYDCVPWNDSIEYNKSILYEKTAPYFKQLKPENSVIILAIKETQSFTCNNESKFDLDCDYFKNDSNIKETNFYDVQYINSVFNSTKLEENLIKDKDNFDIHFEKNEFKSIYSDPCNDTEEDNNFNNFTSNQTLNRFYFKRYIKKNLCVQKVIIKFHLYHPFLNNNYNKTIDEYEKKCYYFLIMEMFTAIKKKINEELSDAISANNDISFGQTENYLYILVTCFTDQAYKISERIKNIIFDNDWIEDFFDNNDLYKNETIDEFFIYDKANITEIAIFYFKNTMKNDIVFNKYEFFPEDFVNNFYNNCIHIDSKENIIKYLTLFILEGYIYGYYEENEAVNLSKLFEINNENELRVLIKKVNISTDVYNYLNWTKKINETINTKNFNISGKVYNQSEYGHYQITYRSIDYSPLNVSIIQNIFSNLKINENSSLTNREMIIYNKKFLELTFYNDMRDIKTIVNHLNLFEGYEQLNIEVDNIGTRYYYMLKNYMDLLNKKQASLYDRALYEINYFDQKGTVLDNKEIIDEYNRLYNNTLINKEGLKVFIDYASRELKNSPGININTTDI